MNYVHRTVKLNEIIHTQLKIEAVKESTSMQDLVERALIQVYGFKSPSNEGQRVLDYDNK